MKKDNRDIELQSRITFKFVHEKQIDILRNGIKVGEIWSWKPADIHVNSSIYPFSEKEGDYVEKNSIQICGFSQNSETWSCGSFEGKRDIVLTFDGLKYSQEPEPEEIDWNKIKPLGKRKRG